MALIFALSPVPKYSYLAKTFSGETKSGALEAKNEQELARILRQEGCVLISASSEEKKKRGTKFVFSMPLLGKISLTEKMIFTRNLKVMISAGISLPRALRTLAEQTKSKKFKKAILEVSEEITRGQSFSESLERFPNVFSELFASMVKAGEESGTLEDVLDVLTKQMEREHELRSKIKGAMIYPAVIITAMIGIGIMMLILVVPKLAETFSELNIELPLTTRIVIFIGTSLANFWYLLPVVILIAWVVFQMVLKSTLGKFLFDTIVLRIPIISSIIKKTNSAYTVRTLSSLIAAGVPLVKSLLITSGTLKNIYYKKAINKAVGQIEKGEKLSQFLSQYQDIYPLIVIQMIGVGEETGQMTSMLQKLADFFEEEVTNATKNLSAVIEPVLMIIVGAVVGFFVISMVQPMYSMIQAIK